MFCDVSTPAADGWNAYDELRALLSAEASTTARFGTCRRQDRRRQAKLFAACRDGTVSVLIGSTETMGVGTNVQARHRHAPSRRLASRRHRTTRRTNPPPGQPEPGGPGAALRHRGQLRHLHVADAREEGRVHRPGHPAATCPTAMSTTSATKPSPSPSEGASPPATPSCWRRPPSASDVARLTRLEARPPRRPAPTPPHLRDRHTPRREGRAPCR